MDSPVMNDKTYVVRRQGCEKLATPRNIVLVTLSDEDLEKAVAFLEGLAPRYGKADG